MSSGSRIQRSQIPSVAPATHPLHRETTLLYQQKVAALIECAREYSMDPHEPHKMANLLKIAMAFAENA